MAVRQDVLCAPVWLLIGLSGQALLYKVMNECKIAAGRWYFQRPGQKVHKSVSAWDRVVGWGGVRGGLQRAIMFWCLAEISDYNWRHPAAQLQIDHLTFSQLQFLMY